MEVRIALFVNDKKIESVCYPVKDKEFFDKLFEYADLLGCKEESSPPSKEEVKEEQKFADTGLDDYLTNIEKEENR